jgi:molybdopterin-guanine dinucleotide biosynthesis protein A
MPPSYAVLVLTGGTGRRLGGVDKAALQVGGMPLLDRVLSAVSADVDVVVVGDPVATSRPVTFCREDPAGGGPAAAVLAGLDQLAAMGRAAEVVIVLAVDLPFVTPATVIRLVSATVGDGAVLVDGHGRRQYLAAAYRTAALAAARPAAGREEGLSMRALVRELRLVTVEAVGGEARDVDTAEDLEASRSAFDDRTRD